MAIVETSLFAFAFAALLTPVHLGVFFFEKRRSRDLGAAIRFTMASVLTVMVFVYALAGAGALLDGDDGCGQLGGEVLAFETANGQQDTICVVGA